MDERLLAAGAPPSGRVTNAIAAGQGAASILAYGSEEQKRRYLRPLFTAEMMGCQLYSEPGSGSDLASLSTRAERHGDEWIVNGQKVWTSGWPPGGHGHSAGPHRPGRPEARRPDAVRAGHARPRRRGSAPAPDDRRGRVQRGLPHRRPRPRRRAARGRQPGLDGVPAHARLRALQHAADAGPGRGSRSRWRSRPGRPVRTRRSAAALALRAELMRHWVDAEVVRLLQMRAGVLRSQGSSGPEGSLGKLAVSTAGRRLAEWAPALLGPAGDAARGGLRRRDTPAASAAGATAQPADGVRGKSRAWPSPAARTRFSATSSATGCSACPASRRSTGVCPGARRCGTEAGRPAPRRISTVSF